MGPKRRSSVPVPASAPDAPPEFRLGFYAASLFIPFVGIVIALFLIESDSKLTRRLGRNCLLVGFLVWVLLPTLVFLLLAIAAVAAVGGMFSGLMPLDY